MTNVSHMMARSEKRRADDGPKREMSRIWWLAVTNVSQMVARSDECVANGSLECQMF